MDLTGDLSPVKQIGKDVKSSPSKIEESEDLLFGGFGVPSAPPITLGLGEIKNPIPTEATLFEEDLMREFDQKASELSTFLDESHPISTSGGNIDLLSSSTPERSMESSPNPPMHGSGIVSGGIGSSGFSDFDPMGDFKNVAGGDTKLAEELISAAKDIGKESPTANDFGFEPKTKGNINAELGNFLLEEDPPASLEKEVEFHYTQSEPMMMHYQQGIEFNQGEQMESPKLPDITCFQQDPFSLEKISKSAPEVDPSPKHPIPDDVFFLGTESTQKTPLDEYTRRETMTFDPDEDSLSLSQKDSLSMDSHPEIPPPVPKHAYEIHEEITSNKAHRPTEQPPPIPRHADDSIFGRQEPPFIHASYDDKIDDDFEDDSLSRQLSNKLSDSLEVLKDSPQKEDQLDESLMGLDELPESPLKSFGGFPTSIQSIPSEMKESTLFSQKPPTNLDDAFEFSTGGMTTDVENKPMASIPPFSSKGNNDLGDGVYQFTMDSSMTSSMIMNTSLDEIQAPKFYESEDSSASASNKDLLVPDISNAGKVEAEKDEFFDDLFPHDKNTLIQDEPLKMETFSSAPVPQSKVDVAEIKPISVKKTDEIVTKPKSKESEGKKESRALAKPIPKQKIEVDGEFEINEETQQILNILNPRAWFDPAKLHPTVGELIYWRDPKKSGAAFGSIFVVLIALTFLSLISVIAYTSLAVLTGTFAFRVYKTVLQAVQKTNEGHPFKEYLDLDITFSSEKAQELSNAIINYGNAFITQLRRLFLVEDFVDSAKFGAFLYFLTYIGGWFNGLTLIILGIMAIFSLPKVYETNKVVIDQYLDLVWGKISEIYAKVSAAVPFLKKEKAQ